ncbi:phage repressor protein CI [Klebsiella quasipneumoniae subsp. similipneumoniae]|uniref:Phage repressor protein CI n=1 Tax=Klebsiella quasipneumoniae subsp. similipneumoniae TaxID=1463164 RepID=A0AAE4SES1_9ENTR|nr:phage repressor protein CI [Klebsiella quasipneumoniae]MDV0609067.1 phage repressor protein CI [Klebsiella quasipneumoniae subsp. similipneumoniae]MDV0637871.1 phage repressor protein CI [Klebsiella quasipneumoniae subsp. similipneumoniae]MDV0724343.1 phage repressor protein CI [Klebsiella quasipneumoniae subsp. similipneumoniae]MDV0735362.1 phage repressor protein CI [Klebsiella quasipneumoniae subsp. similipneumoniae]MDV0761690.1 phage repressor protein CI [Klebsiella quasipneumoniae subs
MPTSKYPNEIKINPNQGGKAAIERLVEAYGFTTRQALADHLEVSKSTLANRYMRDTFPADWIIQCALETGTPLTWLTNGEGPVYENAKSDVLVIKKRSIVNGELHDSDFLLFDKSLISDVLQKPLSIVDAGSTYIADEVFDEISDGFWLVEIEGKYSIRELTRIPVGKVKVINTGSSFECLLSDIRSIAKCMRIYKEI